MCELFLDDWNKPEKIIFKNESIKGPNKYDKIRLIFFRK